LSYDNTNTGALFKNVEKDEEHPNWPDYKGSLNVGGQEFWLSAWVKTGKEGSKVAGKKFFSLTVQPKEDKSTKNQLGTVGRRNPGDDDSDIPFSPIRKLESSVR
jgi:hypothetical protein